MAEQSQGEVEVQSQVKTAQPRQYHVVMHNDDYTAMEFVVAILVQVFNKPKEEADQIMMIIHTKGKEIVGTYPYDIAVSKVNIAHELAKSYEFPLQCSIVESVAG